MAEHDPRRQASSTGVVTGTAQRLLHRCIPHVILRFIAALVLTLSCAAGLAYQLMPCCCGTPAAVRKVSGHLSKYGAHPTCNACCPCCHECQPRHTSEFGKSESVKGEVATGSWCCYCMCPPCYIRTNRELFEMQHNLPGMRAQFFSPSPFTYVLHMYTNT